MDAVDILSNHSSHTVYAEKTFIVLHFMPQPLAFLTFVVMFGAPVYVAMHATSQAEVEFDEDESAA